ncbi:hypothetical protein GPX89_01275 [Nocardia sp. ET3-3]|uniref:Uncharacterized protein n=1 Tax=Nocardia terrae TaxID=2675851 RepID=A0A7K1UNG0_9NOCA|nr:hypothetical protein [Nocardia terrae]MVU75874.1 hypothetical protein [Nocardia terrae]
MLAVACVVSCGSETRSGLSEAPSTAVSAPQTSSTAAIALTEVDAGPYTGQAFGTHFTAASGKIACNFNPMQGGCVFSAPEHRAADSVPVCLGSDTPMPYTAVGWRSAEGLASQTPSTCRIANAFFNSPAPIAADGRFTDAALPTNSTMTITLGWPDTSNKVTCTSTAVEFRCVQAKSGHGFGATSAAINVF